jgi:hypothetical protein
VKLYDVCGREVLVLLDAKLEPGYHTTSVEGTGLASGIYFCRMSANGFSQTRRLVLLR